MHFAYSNCKVDASILSEKVACFFRESGLRASIKGKKSEFEIVGELWGKKRRRIARVVLTSKKDGSLDVVFEPLIGRDAAKLSSFLALLGGGFLALRNIKESETVDGLEKEFWVMLDEAVGSEQ